MPKDNNLLQKLEEQRAKLDARIKAVKAEEAKKAAALYDEQCRIVGAAVLAEMKQNNDLRSIVQPVLNARTTGKKARKIIGLSPLPPKGTESGIAANDDTGRKEEMA